MGQVFYYHDVYDNAKRKMIMTLYDELTAHGLIAQVTDEEEIKELVLAYPFFHCILFYHKLSVDSFSFTQKGSHF